MLKLFQPDYQASSLDRIPVKVLVEQGIRGLMIDLDNTMTPWNDVEVGPKVTGWFKKIEAAGIKTCVLSNNRSKQRVAVVAEHLKIPFVYRASKPRERAYKAGISILGTKKEETAVIGDQLFTDILGGNKAGLYTILVLPMSDREFVGTRFLRLIEKLLLKIIKIFSPVEASTHIR